MKGRRRPDSPKERTSGRILYERGFRGAARAACRHLLANSAWELAGAGTRTPSLPACRRAREPSQCPTKLTALCYEPRARSSLPPEHHHLTSHSRFFNCPSSDEKHPPAILYVFLNGAQHSLTCCTPCPAAPLRPPPPPLPCAAGTHFTTTLPAPALHLVLLFFLSRPPRWGPLSVQFLCNTFICSPGPHPTPLRLTPPAFVQFVCSFISKPPPLQFPPAHPPAPRRKPRNQPSQKANSLYERRQCRLTPFVPTSPRC